MTPSMARKGGSGGLATVAGVIPIAVDFPVRLEKAGFWLRKHL